MQKKTDRIQISEIFTSIEGEGIFFGTKTMFVRMAGCHLKCLWCDTAYALPMKSGHSYTLGYVKNLISKHLQPNTYKVNFTGGEPLLQHESIIDICKIEFKMSDSKVVNTKHYANLLCNEIQCLNLSIENHKTTYIKIVI